MGVQFITFGLLTLLGGSMTKWRIEQTMYRGPAVILHNQFTCSVDVLLYLNTHMQVGVFVSRIQEVFE